MVLFVNLEKPPFTSYLKACNLPIDRIECQIHFRKWLSCFGFLSCVPHAHSQFESIQVRLMLRWNFKLPSLQLFQHVLPRGHEARKPAFRHREGRSRERYVHRVLYPTPPTNMVCRSSARSPHRVRLRRSQYRQERSARWGSG